MSILSITALQKSYAAPGGARALVVDVPSFSLDAGRQVALHGESGSGKTTFLHLIAGILAADSGSIVVDGHDMAALREPARDRVRGGAIGYIFQTFNLLQGLTCLENVVLGMAFGPEGVNRGRAVGLLERMGLASHLKHRPRQLSTGQQQRVAVARALANRPKLVLADEPTGNLDRRNSREALVLIREVCRESNAALLLVSHDPEVLAAFEDVREFADLNRAMKEAAK